MASLQNSPSINYTLFLNSFPQVLTSSSSPFLLYFSSLSFLMSLMVSPFVLTFVMSLADRPGRRHIIAAGIFASWVSLVNQNSVFAAENKKGFLPVTDKKDGYTFLYPFGWQEVIIDGQDKVFKDVIEPLENVSVNLLPTSKQDIRDFGPPEQVAETLIKKVLAPPNQKTKLIEAKEQDVDGKAYYTFEFIAKAPNYTRHALSTISIANGKFYTLTTGANERRWEKMKDKLHTVIDSFKISNV
ncbi:hypothetical protein CsatA_018561 [Cannabis sativa]